MQEVFSPRCSVADVALYWRAAVEYAEFRYNQAAESNRPLSPILRMVWIFTRTSIKELDYLESGNFEVRGL